MNRKDRKIRVRVRCSACNRVLADLERRPGHWTPTLRAGVRYDGPQMRADGKIGIVCRCGARPQGRFPADLVDRASELGVDLVFGAPRLGLPHSVQ